VPELPTLAGQTCPGGPACVSILEPTTCTYNVGPIPWCGFCPSGSDGCAPPPTTPATPLSELVTLVMVGVAIEVLIAVLLLIVAILLLVRRRKAATPYESLQ